MIERVEKLKSFIRYLILFIAYRKKIISFEEITLKKIKVASLLIFGLSLRCVGVGNSLVKLIAFMA